MPVKAVVVALLLALADCSAPEETPTERSGNATATDALPASLRGAVEALKQAVSEQPTDAETIAERSRTLADWINGHALAGGEGSPFATTILRNAIMPPGSALAGKGAELDALVREYRLRDEEPEALGTLAAESLGPFTAGSFGTIRQTWTAGSRGMDPGGGLWLARHFSVLHGAYQTDDPAAEGFVTIASSDADAVFAPEIIMASGPHGGFRAPEPALAFRLIEGRVDPGETVSVTYGDTSGGGPGLKIATVSGESVPMPVYVALEGDGDWMMLPIQPFVIQGAEVAGVHGFGPSVVAPGETFEFSVRAQDIWYNRASGDIPAFDILVNGAVAASTAAGSEAIQVLMLSLDEPGPHWFEIRSQGGAIVGGANPVLVTEDPALRIFWGDTHGHSGYAEGIGTVDYFMRFARDEARLDFVTHSEHDVWLDDAEWQLMRETTAEYDAPGRFIPYLGYEWTMVARNGGHHNVLYRTTEGRERVSALIYPTLSGLYQELRSRYAPQDIVVIPHAHNPGDARHSDPLLEPLIEIMSMHGTFEWFIRNYLSNGHQVGFVAASDDHLSHPGYSAPSRLTLAQRGGLGAVLAPERSRDAIFDGMRARRTYATTGDRMILDVRLNGALMGERTEFAEERELRGRVIGTTPIDSITIFKNNLEVWREDYLTDQTSSGSSKLRLAFLSDATPKHWGDAPRGWRHWRGRLRVEGGRIVSARGVDFVNPNAQSLVRDGESYQFATISRGDASPIELELADLTEQATIVLEIEDALETGSAPPFYRTHQVAPGGTFRLPLAEMADGVLAVQVPAPDYVDAILLRHIIENGPRDVSFEVTDSEDPRQGDYYYVRVRQANDATAWSSPIWVGGYPHR
jgi:hypothetical protein